MIPGNNICIWNSQYALKATLFQRDGIFVAMTPFILNYGFMRCVGLNLICNKFKQAQSFWLLKTGTGRSKWCCILGNRLNTVFMFIKAVFKCINTVYVHYVYSHFMCITPVFRLQTLLVFTKCLDGWDCMTTQRVWIFTQVCFLVGGTF